MRFKTHYIMTLTESQGHGQRSRKVTLPYFSETIKATVTTLGTKVLCDNALPNSYYIMTLTEGQGHKGQGQRSRKVTLPYFSETIEATVTKLGTEVLCENALQNMYYTMALTEGHKSRDKGHEK